MLDKIVCVCVCVSTYIHIHTRANLITTKFDQIVSHHEDKGIIQILGNQCFVS